MKGIMSLEGICQGRDQCNILPEQEQGHTNPVFFVGLGVSLHLPVPKCHHFTKETEPLMSSKALSQEDNGRDLEKSKHSERCREK